MFDSAVLLELEEAIEYCQNNTELIKQEAEAERLYLEERGVILEPKIID